MTCSAPQGWTWSSIDELASPEPNSLTDGPFGSKLKTEHYTPSGVRVIRLGNLGVGRFNNHDQAFISKEHAKTLQRHLARPGDLLISALAEPVGRCCKVPEELDVAIVKADCLRLRPSPRVINDIIMLWLNSPNGRAAVERLSHGIGRLRISLQDLKQVPVPLPPLNEQRRIVAKIEALMARSARAKEALDAIPALLDRYRQSVLAAAFRGDLTTDWRAQHPNVEPASELLERIFKHPCRIRKKYKHHGRRLPGLDDDATSVSSANDSDLGTNPYEVPQAWIWSNAASIVEPGADIVYGIVQPGPHVADGTPYVRGRDIQDGQVLTGQLLRTSPEIAKRYERASLAGGDILLGIIRATKVAVVPDELNGGNITQGTARLRPSHAIQRDYLAAWLMSPFAQRWLYNHFRGIDMPGLNLRDVRMLPVPVAPWDEQLALVKATNSALERIRCMTSNVASAAASLASLDQSILAKAFRGELVPQDPNDEPASALLARIKAERATTGTPSRRGGRRKRAAAHVA